MQHLTFVPPDLAKTGVPQLSATLCLYLLPSTSLPGENTRCALRPSLNPRGELLTPLLPHLRANEAQTSRVQGFEAAIAGSRDR